VTPASGTPVLAYVRVSTDKQSLSPGAQLERIQGHCVAQGLALVGTVTETASAGTGKRRPELDQAMARLDAGEAKALVVASLDRLARSTVDFAGILARAKQRGWAVVCLNPSVDMSTPEGELVATVIMAMAQYERALVSRRTRVALDAQRERRPEGFISREVEDRILGLADEGLGVKAIARTLASMGVPTARGGGWSHKTVGPALERARARRDLNGKVA